MDANEYKQKLDELLKIDRETVKDLPSHLYSIANCYHNLSQYDKESVIYEQLISIKPTATYWNNLAVSLENQNRLSSVLGYYKKALSFKEKDSIIVSNFIRYVTSRHLFSTANSMNLGELEYDYRLKYILQFAVVCVNKQEINAFSLTDGFKISENCEDYADNFIIKDIFDMTADLPNKCVLRALLLSLYLKVGSIKKKLKYTSKNDNIGHYTRIENLKSLVKRDEDTFLRLYNVQYMNDPSEGNVFFNLIEKAYGKKIFNGKTEEGRKSINNSNTYLGSFSRNIDSLPLWIQYGNDGTGCCLVFDESYFDEDEPIANPKQSGLTISISSGDNEIVEDKYVLYQVEYVNSLDNCEFKNTLKSIGQILSNLFEECKKDADCSDITTYAMNILDSARFLFKGSDYAHEQELRLIKWSADPDCDAGMRSREIPFLYIELEKPIELKEVFLGPKVSKPTDIAPYLYYTNKVEKVTQSSIKYQ